MATKKFFDCIVSGKYYDKFVKEYTLKAHRMHYGRDEFYIALNSKKGEEAYTIKTCKNYNELVKACKAFLQWLQGLKKFDI